MATALLSTTYFGPVQWYQKLHRSDAVWIEACETFQKQTFRNRCMIATTNGVQTLSVPIEHASSDLRGTRYEVRGTRKDLLPEDLADNTNLVPRTSYPRTSTILVPRTSYPRTSTIKSLRISNHGNWRHQHWNALLSAYGESPFFDYYADDIRPFFERQWTFLYDFNMEITQKMIELLDIRPKIHETMEFLWEGVGARERESENSFVAEKAADHTNLALSPSRSSALSKSLSPIKDFRDAIHPKHPQPDADFQPRPYYQVYQQKHGFLPNLSILDLLFNMGNEAILYL